MPQITQLDNDPTPNNNDLLVTVDMAAGTTKNISREQFFTGAPLPAGTVDTQAIADDAVTSDKLADDAVTSDKLAPSKTVDANGWTVYDMGTFKRYAKNFQITTSATVQAGNVAAVLNPGKTPVGQAMGANDVYVASGVRVPHTASGRQGTLQAQPRWNVGSVGGDIAIILSNPSSESIDAQYYWISIEITTL